MKTISESTFVDKSKWGDGPWMNEPDKVQLLHEETGLDALIVRGPVGALCGYVGVPEGHPMFGKNYSSCTRNPPCDGWCEHSPDRQLEVHGGVTFSDFCREDEKEHGICHRPIDGRPDKVYWFGFDCGHSGDLDPGMGEWDWGFMGHGTYRTIDYVKSEIENLATQLAKVNA